MRERTELNACSILLYKSYSNSCSFTNFVTIYTSPSCTWLAVHSFCCIFIDLVRRLISCSRVAHRLDKTYSGRRFQKGRQVSIPLNNNR